MTLAALAAACSDSTAPRPQLTLTEAQSAAIGTRLTRIGDAVPELAWLADSVALAVAAGVQVQPMDIDVVGAATPFYLLGVQRTFAADGFSTFHLLGFDDLSAPTRFVIVGASAPGEDGEAPASTSGEFGSGGVTAHYVAVNGLEVHDFVAFVGSASFKRGMDRGACDVQPTHEKVSCNRTDLTASATVNVALDSFGQQRWFTVPNATLPGVLYTYLP